MSTVVIDISPLSSAHQGRGIGTYTKNLVDALKKAAPPRLTFKFANKPNQMVADLYHYPYFDLFFATLPSKYQPFIVTIHDVIPLLYPHQFPPGVKGKFNFYRQRRAVHQAAAILTDSQSSRSDIHRFLNINLDRIHVVYLAANPTFHPVSADQVSRFKTHHCLPDKFLAYVGDINYNKNLPNLINAINHINTPLIIVTRSQLDLTITEKQTVLTTQAINDALNNLTPSKQVRFLNLPDTQSLNLLYNAATWYIQPSLAEGFGLPLLEAMQAGTPVIAARATSLPEIASKAALYFNPESLESLINILHQAESIKQSHYLKLSQQGIKQARNFTWTQTAVDTIKVYRSVLNQT